MNKTNPLISVIMPVYNGEKYLSEAIESILNQTYENFEFIIINDASIDKTEEIILSYKDDRLIYLKNDINMQRSKARNKGIAIAKGKYIALMDADDISYKARFQEQIKFLENNDSIGVCGTWIKTIGTVHEKWTMPLEHENIIMQMIFSSSIMNPTAMIRRSVLEEHSICYDEKFEAAEDYDLWSRLVRKTKFSNIPKVLLLYRINNTAIERKIFKKNEKKFSDLVRNRYVQDNKFNLSKKETNILNLIANKNYTYTKEFFLDISKLFLKIRNQNMDFVSIQTCEYILLKKMIEIHNSFVFHKINIEDIYSIFENKLNYKFYKLKVKKIILNYIIKFTLIKR